MDVTSGRNHSARRKAGFTLTEMGIVVGLVGALAAIAAPSISRMFDNQRLTDSALLVSQAISLARGEAIRTGNVHLVYFRVDETGADLTDNGGNDVDILVVNDGRLGSGGQNCQLDAGEGVASFDLGRGVSFGVTDATGPVVNDAGLAAITNGSSLEQGNGAAASWLLFRSEGPAYGFRSNCTIGAVGSGGGGVYLTNGDRDVAIVISPLGAARMHRWADAGWTN
jgi:Tfp pilus assembly protein FimT